MPRYYFDVRNRDGFHKDPAGDEFDTFEKARAQAQTLLPDLARGELPDGDLQEVTCDVRDEAGRVRYRGQVTYMGEVDPDDAG